MALDPYWWVFLILGVATVVGFGALPFSDRDRKEG